MFSTAYVLEIAKAPLQQQFAILEQIGVDQLSTGPASKLNALACFLLWANGLLARLSYLTTDTHCRIMATLLADEHIGRDIVFDDHSLRDSAVYRLAISDRRFIATEFLPGLYLDIKTGETVSALPSPTFEAIIYDLAELFRQNAKLCEKAAQDEQRADQQMASGVDKP